MKASDIFEEILDLQVCAALANPKRQAHIQKLLESRMAHLVKTAKCSTECIQEGIKREYPDHANSLIDRLLENHKGDSEPAPEIE